MIMKKRFGFVSNSSSSSFICDTSSFTEYKEPLCFELPSKENQNIEAVDLWLDSKIDSEELNQLIEI